jgi:phosphatidylinositol-3-phosphatase
VKKTPIFVVLALTVFSMACSTAAWATTPMTSTSAPSARCESTQHHVQIRHVVWIFLENTDYRNVIGNPQAPYVNKLASHCRLATNYHGLTHPSLPNYIGATSGHTQFTNDCPPLTCHTRLASIFNQVGSWRDYQGGMNRPCQKTGTSSYEPQHNPAVYYTKLSSQCGTRDLPLAMFKLSAAKFEFVAPNSQVQDQLGTKGDRWLTQWLPGNIFSKRAYRNGSTVVFLTWDESYSPGNHVVLIRISPTSHGKNTRHLNHLWLHAKTRQLLGL